MANEVKHVHTALHTARCDGGITYEVCECGASRRLQLNMPPEPWHACELCTAEWGRK